MIVTLETLLLAVAGFSGPAVTTGVWWAVNRLIGAIDRLSEASAGHNVRLVRVETHLGLEKGKPDA